MIYAYEEGFALKLIAMSGRDVFDLYEDRSGEALFAFADADLQECTDLIVKYIRSRIDVETLQRVTPKEDFLPRLYDALSAVHPFFKCADPAAVLADMLGATLNLYLKVKTVSQSDHFDLLSSLMGPLTAFNFADDNNGFSIADEIPLIERLYHEYIHLNDPNVERDLKKRSITGLSSLQKYLKSYLHWVLDASAVRFRGIDMPTRQRLYARIFGSSNLWQPLRVKEASCVGSPKDQSLKDILYQGILELARHPEEMERVGEETRQKTAVEIERQRYAAVMEEVYSDNIDIDADLANWLRVQIEEAKKETSQPLFKAYEISGFSDYILLQLRLLTEHAVIIKRCKNCLRYFITERPNIDYCQRVLPGETQSCYIIGPKRVFNKNLSADVPRGLYSKAYKKYQARLRRGGITEAAFEAWKEEAKRHLERVQNGEIDLVEYSEWMER